MTGEDRLQQGYSRMAAQPPALVRALSLGYDAEELAALPPEALVSFGCGNPVGVARLQEGEAVLDLGSGAGLDALLAARQVGPAGRVVGLDANADMLARARRNAAAAGLANATFQRGDLRQLPCPDASFDVALSNCVLNHSAELAAVFAEVRRVLKPGGRLLVTDLTLESGVPAEVLTALDPQWAEWLKLAVGRQAYLQAIQEGGLAEVELLSQVLYESPAMDERLRGKLASICVRAVSGQ